jgi:hypothetical protein
MGHGGDVEPGDDSGIALRWIGVGTRYPLWHTPR